VIVSRVVLKNWKNFRHVDVRLGDRAFVVGPNASGKSNLLDVFRFLRDVAKPGGGLQRAVADRGGLSRIRSLAARKEPNVEIRVELSNGRGNGPSWTYEIGIKQEPRGRRQPFLIYERVWQGTEQHLNRPEDSDRRDALRLTQTHLEQINSNEAFRDVSEFFQSILYLHLVPQLLRHPEQFKLSETPEDPYGGRFLERIAKATPKTRESRLKKIETALRLAVPQLTNLTLTQDELGVPHLEVLYEHWRPGAGKQREDQFSDGTLRLIALLWILLEGDSLLLLEEPELSLHSEIVRKLTRLIHRIQGRGTRQIVISTHSADLLDDPGIGGEETFLLVPESEGTRVERASDRSEARMLLEGGMTVAHVVLPLTRPSRIDQLALFE
jgi:predicted ATPase